MTCCLRPQEIDEAARRRFVKRLYIPLPDREARKQIVFHLMEKLSHVLSKTDLDTICDKSEGSHFDYSYYYYSYCYC